MRGYITLLLSSIESRELGRIHEDGPDRLARRRHVARQCYVIVLQERQDLHQQKIVSFAQRAQRRSAALVEQLEFMEQVIDLMLERELGEDTDGFRRSQSVLQSGEIEAWR